MGARRRGVVSVLAGLLLVAVLVPVGAGAQSSGDGSVSGVRVWSDSPGVLRVAWSVPDPVASDFRVRWAPVGEGFRSWSDLSGNAFPVSESLSIEGLDADLVYRVQVRARYYDGRGVRLWSGAWSDLVSGAASGGDAVSDVVSRGDAVSDAVSRGDAVSDAVSGGDAVSDAVSGGDAVSDAVSGGDAVSDVVSGGDAAGTVLAGLMTWGSSVSGGSAFVGFSGARSLGAPDRVGGFEMRFLDGAVVRSRTHLFAFAQIAGSVGSGPAAGLSDPVVLTMTSDVDLSSGFTVEVDGCVLASVDAVNPLGDVGAYRYWMWDSPCETWLPGEQAEFRIITTGDASLDGSERAVAPSGLRATVAGGAVHLGWDASPVVAPLRADAPVVYAVWRERVDVSDSGGVGDEPVHVGIAGTGFG